MIAQFFQQPVNTADNTAGEVLDFCLAFGADAEIRYGSSAGNAINGIGCLCFSYPCGGYQLLMLDEKRRMLARVGYGLQERPGAMLAMLAQAAVPANYEVRVGQHHASVAELVESEKRSCRTGSALANALIALSFYVRNEEAWKNASGEEWNVERLLREELDRTAASNSSDITDQLLAVSFAIERRSRAGKPIEGEYRRAEKYVADYQQFAFRLQESRRQLASGFLRFEGAEPGCVGKPRCDGAYRGVAGLLACRRSAG